MVFMYMVMMVWRSHLRCIDVRHAELPYFFLELKGLKKQEPTTEKCEKKKH